MDEFLNNCREEEPKRGHFLDQSKNFVAYFWLYEFPEKFFATLFHIKDRGRERVNGVWSFSNNSSKTTVTVNGESG